MRIARNPLVVAAAVLEREIRARVVIAAIAIAAAVACRSLLLVSAGAVHLHAAAAAGLVLRGRAPKNGPAKLSAAAVVVAETFLALGVIGGVTIAARARAFRHSEVQPWQIVSATAVLLVSATVLLTKQKSTINTLRRHVSAEPTVLFLAAVVIMFVPERRTDYGGARLFSLLTLRAITAATTRKSD